MSKNPNVEKAAQILSMNERDYLSWAERSEALDAAGLLVTPLHQRALEACKEYASVGDFAGPRKTIPARFMCQNVGREAIALEKPKADDEPDPVIERIKRMWRSVRKRNKIPGPLTDALDELIKQPGCAEKPKERWGVAERPAHPGRYAVVDTDQPYDVFKGAIYLASGTKDFTEAQARAVAKALNEVSE